MKFKNTYLALLILALLGGYVYYFEIREEKVRIEREEKEKKIFTVEKDSIIKVSLVQEQKTLVMSKRNKKWYITQPVDDICDRFLLNELVREIAQADSEGVISQTGENEAEYGLDPPKAVLKFETSDGMKDSLRLGNLNITDTYVYVQRVPGKHIFLSGKNLKTQAIDKTLFDYREREVFRYPRREIRQYKLTNAHGVFIMKKEGEHWEMTEPVKARINKDGLDKIINQILKTRSEKFIDKENPDLKDYGLEKPSAQLEIWVGDEKAHRTFMIGKKASEEDTEGSFYERYYAKDVGRKTIFTIDTILVNRMDADLSKLRDTKVAFFSTEDVARITFDYTDSVLVCEKDTSGDWNVVKPFERKAKNWKVNGALSDLENMHAVKFPIYSKKVLNKYGLEKPPVRIVLADEEDKIIGKYAFGKKKGDDIYFLDENDKRLYLVPAHKLDNFIIPANEIAEREKQKASKEG